MQTHDGVTDILKHDQKWYMIILKLSRISFDSLNYHVL